MGESKKLTVTGYITRGGIRVKREELPYEERVRLASAWNNAGMTEAGYVPMKAGHGAGRR